MRKKVLIIIVSAMALSGLFFSFAPFVLSLNPSDKAKSERSEHNISELEPGEYLIENLIKQGQIAKLKVLIIKDWESKLHVYSLPTQDGKVVLPDYSFVWWGFTQCENFGPQLVNNKIKKQGFIVCHDETLDEWGQKNWRWSYTGEPKPDTGKVWIPEMWVPSYEVKGKYLYVNL